MARLQPAPKEQYEAAVGSDALLNMKIWANRPELAVAFLQFSGAVFGSERILPDRIHELARLRIAFHNQCRSCMAVRYVPEQEVPEDLVCSLEKPDQGDDLTAAERVALEYADRLATDHLSIDDAFYDRLREHFTEELPPRFTRRGVTITPWGEGDLIRT